MSVPTLKDELVQKPSAFPGAPSRVEVVETHISWVFLTESEAFKIKKPVFFGFLDFRTLEARRVACEAEVLLNRRLASGVYEEVMPLRRSERGELSWGAGTGQLVEWAVRMKRLPDARRADLLLAKGALAREDVDRIAARIAHFHASSRADEETAAFGTAEAIAVSVEENFAQVGEALARYVSPREADEIRQAQRQALEVHRESFARRVAAGRVRDGHGDLRLEHVYLTGDSPQVIDCIEFNDRFRYGDVCSDVAFLSMDLAHSRAVDLAERLLAQYVRAANDYDLYELVDFYEAYRAFVRGKIAHFVASDAGVDEITRTRAEEQARSYFLLALAANRRPLVAPSLVCVGGVIASGKSTVSDALSVEMNAPVVDADRTRKHMLGVTATTAVHSGAWTGAYDPAFTERVYEEVLRRARVVMNSGRAVILDASFRTRALRAKARETAQQAGVPFVFVECRAPHDVLRQRLVERAKRESVSDGRLEVLEDFLARCEPCGELSPPEHVVIDTTQPVESAFAAVRQRIATWPRGFHA